MNNTSNTPSGGGSTEFRTQGQPAFRIRTDRTVLAAAGLLAVLAVVGGTLLAAFTSVSWFVPVAGLVAVAAVVAMLRALALRDRKRRVENAFRAAMGPDPRSARDRSAQDESDAGLVEESGVSAEDEEEEPEPQRETVLFDRESAPEPDETVTTGSAAPPRITAEDLRAEALKVASATVRVPARPNTTPWQPVELPKPVYIDAPKAERPAPEPIVLPETPRPTKTPLRPAASPAAPPAEAKQEHPETGKINLDDVLQRRRA